MNAGLNFEPDAQGPSFLVDVVRMRSNLCIDIYVFGEKLRVRDSIDNTAAQQLREWLTIEFL